MVQEESLDKLLAKRAKLDEQIKAKKQAVSEEARKASNHAKHLVGGMVLSHFKGEWNEVDFEKLAQVIARHADEIAACCCDALPLKDAKRRLRSWEVEKKPWGEWQPTAKKAAAGESPDAGARAEVSAGADRGAGGDGASDGEGAAAGVASEVYMTRYWGCSACHKMKTLAESRSSDSATRCPECGEPMKPITNREAARLIEKNSQAQ